MGTGPPLLPPDQRGAPASDQVRELLQFLRQENAANRDAVRVEGESSRALLVHTLQIVAVPVTIALAVAGFLGWRSLDSFKESLQTELRSEAKRQTDGEISRMQEEVRQRVRDQFQTPAIQKVVTQAAAEATTTAANPLIKSEVQKEVKTRVAAEQGAINKTVVEQTKVAVKAMNPQIELLVKRAVDTKVQNEVEPVVRQVSGLSSELHRLRTLTAKVDFVFPLSGPPPPSVLGCSVYLTKRDFPIAEFHPVGTPTQIQSAIAGEMSFSTTQELYPPFLEVIISKPISVLDGIDSLSLKCAFVPDLFKQAGTYDAVKLYFDSIKEIRVQISINSVPLDIIRLSGSEFSFPKDLASLSIVQGNPVFSIRRDLSPSPFSDTKKEYDRLTAAPSTVH